MLSLKLMLTTDIMDMLLTLTATDTEPTGHTDMDTDMEPTGVKNKTDIFVEQSHQSLLLHGSAGGFEHFTVFSNIQGLPRQGAVMPVKNTNLPLILGSQGPDGVSFHPPVIKICLWVSSVEQLE